MTELERLDLTIAEVLNSSNGMSASGRGIGFGALRQTAISSSVVVKVISVDAAMNRRSQLVRKLVFCAKDGTLKPFRWLICQSHRSTVTHLQEKQRRFAKSAIVKYAHGIEFSWRSRQVLKARMINRAQN